MQEGPLGVYRALRLDSIAVPKIKNANYGLKVILNLIDLGEKIFEEWLYHLGSDIVSRTISFLFWLLKTPALLITHSTIFWK